MQRSVGRGHPSLVWRSGAAVLATCLAVLAVMTPTAVRAGDATGPAARVVAAVRSAGPRVPIVVVRDFRSTAEAVDRDDLTDALAGRRGYGALELVSADAPAIMASLGLEAADRTRLVLAADPAALAKDLAAHRDRLGVLRASQVVPGLRALAWGRRALFGVGRVGRLEDWPLTAQLAPTATDAAFDPAAMWTLVAGGDVMLDRGVRLEIARRGGDADFPWAGGRARIVGRTCCSSFGWSVPRTKRTGDAGAVRDLLAGADRSIVNLEGPAPDRAVFHAEGTTFSFAQAFLAGLAGAGIDLVSLANNHIGDAGRAGVTQTVRALDRLGIDHAGAGANAPAARAPATFRVGGVTVAVLAYDAIAPGYAARGSTAGSASLSTGDPGADIRAARRAGADVVIVYPHWGVEYRATPTAGQRTWAHRMVDAGADLVVGNHAHWAAGMEVYRGKPIWYALGNLVFDQTWSEETMEGLLLELTFRGTTLVQARLHPTVILDASQPNLLDAGSGRVVLDRVWEGSGALLPW